LRQNSQGAGIPIAASQHRGRKPEQPLSKWLNTLIGLLRGKGKDIALELPYKFKQLSKPTVVFVIVSNSLLDSLKGHDGVVKAREVFLLEPVARDDWGVCVC
jgi:hypothetical protein